MLFRFLVAEAYHGGRFERPDLRAVALVVEDAILALFNTREELMKFLEGPWYIKDKPFRLMITAIFQQRACELHQVFEVGQCWQAVALVGEGDVPCDPGLALVPRKVHDVINVPILSRPAKDLLLPRQQGHISHGFWYIQRLCISIRPRSGDSGVSFGHVGKLRRGRNRYVSIGDASLVESCDQLSLAKLAFQVDLALVVLVAGLLATFKLEGVLLAEELEQVNELFGTVALGGNRQVEKVQSVARQVSFVCDAGKGHLRCNTGLPLSLHSISLLSCHWHFWHKCDLCGVIAI